ncbi:MAG: alpha/beta hydrolase [Gemmatimonadaceae bacterium]|nr:alpha/beta hydrolase [Gemmatimonadaceae bacterium]
MLEGREGAGLAAARLTSVSNVVGDVRMHGLIGGARRGTSHPLVFVHGLGVSSRYLAPTMAVLAERHIVTGPDLPGFGRSASPKHVLSFGQLVDALAAWLDARAIGPAVLIGNSLGCQLIVELARREPGRVRGLVLNAPTMDPARRSMFRIIARAALDIPHEPFALAPIVIGDYLRAGPVRILRTLRDALDDRIENKLPGITVPVAVVCGARDRIVSVQWCEELARLVGTAVDGSRGASFHLVPHGAHALPFEHPHTCAAFIESLVSRVSP